MATKKKITAKPKQTPRTTVAKPAAANPRPKIAKPAAAPNIPSVRTITLAERQRMIEESAYYRAERAGFTGSPDEHWSAAEKEIDARLARENVRVA